METPKTGFLARAHMPYISISIQAHTGILQVNRIKILEECIYGRCSKTSNTSCQPKISRQTVQIQIRLLLKKQSDQDLPCLLF